MTMKTLTHRGSLTQGITAINGNFSALLSAVEALEGRVTAVVGSYTGTRDSSNYIELAFRPKLVLATCKCNNDHCFVALSIEGMDNGYLELTETGFHPQGYINWTVEGGAGINGTAVNPYRYIALTWPDDE